MASLFKTVENKVQRSRKQLLMPKRSPDNTPQRPETLQADLFAPQFIPAQIGENLPHKRIGAQA